MWFLSVYLDQESSFKNFKKSLKGDFKKNYAKNLDFLGFKWGKRPQMGDSNISLMVVVLLSYPTRKILTLCKKIFNNQYPGWSKHHVAVNGCPITFSWAIIPLTLKIILTLTIKDLKSNHKRDTCFLIRNRLFFTFYWT